ncbi:pilus assembly protein [Variovorax sp. RTB1]|jgi:Flp pilus assembly pilin Flp|uniref:Flp family type IVb pilin n=1 Tax=Variovorax sp. RTB1 TaxID=3048631 RepID=UPI002B22FF4C|nr:pilus assembly protein [Variovorax sp. RTB1]MEB0111990.1 pilus assembly protein [Variovorax sp. RTB1]
MNTQRLSQVRRRIVSKIKVKGQGMTEYLVILGLIAISAIAVFSFFGQTLRNQVAGMSQEVGGKTGSAEVTKAQTAAGKGSTNADVNYNMSTYTKGAADGAK